MYCQYLNIYNKEHEKALSIKDGIKLMVPYFIWLTITWIIILLLWYIVGLPIGPGVYPTL